MSNVDFITKKIIECGGLEFLKHVQGIQEYLVREVNHLKEQNRILENRLSCVIRANSISVPKCLECAIKNKVPINNQLNIWR